jgi:hypothetical protein
MGLTFPGPGHDGPDSAGFDSIGFAVTRQSGVTGPHVQVQVFVNGAEMTARGAGLGMDPYQVFVPDNRLVAGPEPHRTPIARCACGTYGCRVTDVTITARPGEVTWEWHRDVPMRRPARFAPAAYAAALERLVADRSWETPDRVAGRLVLSGADRPLLAGSGLDLLFVDDGRSVPGHFSAVLDHAGTHQVVVAVPWEGRGPDEVAADLVAVLAAPPARWKARWRPLSAEGTTPPAIAGPEWQEHTH